MNPQCSTTPIRFALTTRPDGERVVVDTWAPDAARRATLVPDCPADMLDDCDWSEALALIATARQLARTQMRK